MKRSIRAFTLIEVTVVSGIMVFMLASIGAMCISTMRSYDSATTRTFTDTDAAMAMQRIVSDVREARRIKLIANENRLRIIMPKQAEGHDYYDRYKDDTAHQYDYYLSDSTGVPGHNGTWLWRGKNNNDRRPIAKNVSSLEFETAQGSNPQNYVKITIVIRQSSSIKPIETKLTQRVVYLRNY